MIRRFIFCTTALLLILFALGSCGQGKKNRRTTVEAIDSTPDEAMLVKLNKVDRDSIYTSLVRGFGDKTFCLKGSTEVKGSIQVGDTLSIFPENRTKSIKMCINVSELQGRWFYDMKQQRGFSFDKTGGMASINTDDIAFREWKLLNGKLYICYVDMQQVAEERNEYQVEEAEITYLDKSHLEINFHDKDYKCERMTRVLKFGEQ